MTDSSTYSDMAFAEDRGLLLGVIGEIEKVVLGKHRVVELLVTSLLAGGHILIEDVPGVGKTTIASALARATGMNCNRVQFTPDVMASDITGFSMYNKATGTFEYKSGLVMCNILIADEINRTSPKTQSSLLEVMEEHRVTVDGINYPVPDPFMVVATQNPLGFVGTYPLPEAQLDRFMLKISMGYPSDEEEVRVITDRKKVNPLYEVRQILSVEKLVEICSHVREIYLDESIARYIVTLVSKTRSNENIALGASPRASMAVMKLAQAKAFLAGRAYVVPEDVSAVFVHALNHRVVLKQEAKLNRLTCEQVLTAIRASVPMPYVNAR